MPAVFLIVAIMIVVAVSYRAWHKKKTRKALLSTKLSDHQREIVAKQFPLVRKLPLEFHSSLEGKINLFLSQVTFHGCDGLEVTEEMELSIAAQACLLVVNSDQWYKTLRTVLIYPGAFTSKKSAANGHLVTNSRPVRLGESWARGPVVLSWPHANQGGVNSEDGQNVVIHEFAHQLDDLSGQTNGVPILGSGQTFAEWERVIMDAFEHHVTDVEKGRKTVIDEYGAEGYEEFFAVSVEVFFEKPAALKKDVPQLYQQLTKLFGLDPANWE